MTATAPDPPRHDNPPPPPTPWPPRRTGVRFRVERHDSMVWLTMGAVGGLGAAAVLAAIGGFPLDLPMPTHAMGFVAPTCGLTRGSTAIARGDIATAWHYNPASFAVMGLGALAAIRAIVGWATGWWVNPRGHLRARHWVLIAVGLLILWVHQQANADFVINARV